MKFNLVCVVAVGVLMLGFFPAPGIVETTVAEGEQEKIAHPEVPRISGYEARKLFEEGKAIIVNAQEENAQKRTMLLGAIGAPSGRINGSLIKIPEGIMLVFYCV